MTAHFLNSLAKRVIMVFILIAISFFSTAQVNFKASLSSTKVGVRQQFSATYTLSGASAEAFERPPFEGFRLMGQSSMRGGGSMQVFQNGQLVSSSEGEQSWTFNLLPTSTGNFDISPARVKVNGEWIQSPSLRVSVFNNNQAPSPSQTQTQTQTQAQTQTPQNQKQEQTQQGLNSDDILVVANADKSSAYVGEPIVITYKILTRVTIPSYAINKIPAFEGFWSENLVDPGSKVQQTEETYNGKRYTSALLRKIIVYPQRSGRLNLASLEVDLIARIVRQQQRQNQNNWIDQMFSLFGNPFGGDPFAGFGSSYEDIRTSIKSNVVSVNVKDLPTKNRTTDFSGQVGQYSMEAWIDKDKILLDDAFNLFVKIGGNGNMSLLEPPHIQFPSTFDVFDPQTEDNVKKTIHSISGNKVFSFLIIPREAGKFKIPPIQFTYFDPQAGDYKTLASTEFAIQVFGQNGTDESHLQSETAQDIRFIIPHANKIKHSNTFFFGSIWHWILFVLPLPIFIFILIYLRRRILLYSNQELLRYKKATKMARKRLKKATQLLKSAQIHAFYEETARAIWAYLSHRFGIQQSELSIEKVIDILNQQQVDSDILTSLKQTLDFCEYIRFSPGASSITPGQILTEAENTIRNLEQHIQESKRRRQQS